MDFTVPSEWTDLARTVREFCDGEVEPVWRRIEDDDAVPREVLAAAAKLGLFGLTIPTEYGGLDLPVLARALVYEALGRTHAGFVSTISAHCGIGTSALVALASDEQKRAYLPKMASGEWIGALALTEPDAGSDAAALGTTATRRGERWVLNGKKHLISNSSIATVFTVFAVTDATKGGKGISAFVVPRDTKGLGVGEAEPMMGLRGSQVGRLDFTDCELPAGSLLGAEGAGYSAVLKTLAQSRVGLAARSLGAASRCLELARDHAKQRVQFGRPIADFQAIQFFLADMATEIEAARLVTYHAAWLIDQGQAARREAASAKLIATETYGRVVDRAVQIHGGMGYMRETPIEHYYRDARVTRLYEGTSEIQRMIIARELLEA
jgi:acyl-CoA dehydrogenase